MENKEYIDELLIRYWDGSANREDKEYLLDWLKSDNDNRHYFNTSFDLWIASLSPNQTASRLAFDRFQSTIEKEEKSKKVFKLRSYIPRVAAIAMLTLIGYFVVQYTDFWKKEIYVQEVIMPHGSKGKVELPDGTIVWLNSASKITYPKEFSTNSREVMIEGQGYFEVASDKKRPFTLKADDVLVTVLGTKFDVQNYPSKEEINVTLIEGRISVSNDYEKKEQILSPNEKYTYQRSDRTNHIDKTKAAFSNVWINDKLIFENKRLSDIIPYIENWFGVVVVCDKDLANNTRLTFTVRQDSLEDILQSIEYISTLNFRLENNTIYIQ